MATAAIMNVKTEIDLVMHKRNGVLRILTQFGSTISNHSGNLGSWCLC